MLKELAKSLSSLGVSTGQNLCVYSDLDTLGIPAEVKENVQAHGPEHFLAQLSETLQFAVGPNGVLIMPAFTFSACKGELFDPELTPSTVGALPEYFRTLPGVARSLHPIFSVAGWGGRSKDLLTIESWDCFGPGSFFDKMIASNGAYLLLGGDLEKLGNFVIHAMQAQRVNYRYFKHFKAKIKTDFEKTMSVQVPYYVRDLDKRYRDAWKQVEADAIRAGIIHTANYGDGRLLYMKARRIDDFLQDKIHAQPTCLIEMEL